MPLDFDDEEDDAYLGIHAGVRNHNATSSRVSYGPRSIASTFVIRGESCLRSQLIPRPDQ